MQRLNRENLDAMNQSVEVPQYDRNQAVGIVHLGTGAFHRAHQAAYFDKLMRLGETGWMIQGASLRSSKVGEQLNPQDGLYALIVRDRTELDLRIVGSIRHVLVAPDNPQALIDRIVEPSVSLLTLTVTEKGYRPALVGGGLDMEDEGVRHDLKCPDRPKTALGFVTAGLLKRFETDAGPITLLSCDNMPENGDVVRRGVLALATQHGNRFIDWIDANCAFPSSMVDRIVPATTPEDVSDYAGALGVEDRGLVKTEPFTQWVVEDWFAGRRPPLEKVGVQMTSEVSGWENAKLRLLNGAHSAIAYLGYFAGYQFVHEAMEDPAFAHYINRLWDEAEETLGTIDGFDPKTYRRDLSARFRNSALQHRTFQIAMDGSQKLPQRLLRAIVWHRERGRRSPALELAVAAWMRWQFGRDEQGRAFVVDDPLAEQTRSIVEAAHFAPCEVAAGLCQIDSIFMPELSNDKAWVSELGDTLSGLIKLGAQKSVEQFQT